MERSEIKSKWIAMRNAKSINPQLLYDYAIHYADSKLTPNEFSAGLQFQDINAMIDRVDHELELNILYDKSGQFIKVIEQ
jgi:hypothetical protein